MVKGPPRRSPSAEPEEMQEAEWQVAMARREKEVQAQMARWKEEEKQLQEELARRKEAQAGVTHQQAAGPSRTQAQTSADPSTAEQLPAGTMAQLVKELAPIPRAVRMGRPLTRSQTRGAPAPSQDTAELRAAATRHLTASQTVVPPTRVAPSQQASVSDSAQAPKTGLSPVPPLIAAQHRGATPAEFRVHGTQSGTLSTETNNAPAPCPTPAAPPSVRTRPPIPALHVDREPAPINSFPHTRPLAPADEALAPPEFDPSLPYPDSMEPTYSRDSTPQRTLLPSPALTTPSPSTSTAPLAKASLPSTAAPPVRPFPHPKPDSPAQLPGRVSATVQSVPSAVAYPPPPPNGWQALERTAGLSSAPREATRPSPTVPQPSPTPTPTPLFQHIALLATGWQLLHRNLKVAIQYDEANETAEMLKSVSAFSTTIQNAVAAGVVTGGEALQLQLKWDRIEHGLEDPSQLVYKAIADRMLADAKKMQEAVRGVATAFGLGALVPDE